MHLVWHRRDLRLHDLPALQAAVDDGPTLGVVTLDPDRWGRWSRRRQAWFCETARALRDAYRARGSDLILRRGDPAETLGELVDTLEAYSIRVTTPHDPVLVDRDHRVEEALPVLLYDYPGAYIQEPGTIHTKEGDGYRVFGPYSRSWLERELPDIVEAPDEIPAPEVDVDPKAIPDVDADVPLPDAGEEAARDALQDWLDTGIRAYHEQRDRLDGSGSSRLSPHLAVGSLSPRLAARDALLVGGEGPRKWVEELIWRDFLADLLARHPRIREEPLSRRWKDLDWNEDEEAFEAWKEGETGVPVVDAAMRQLREEGWISNRARMVAAQFLTKNLVVPWQWGEAVFRDRLLDADPPSNVGNWQWAAGLGVDNAPYFRVMNPVKQGREHDPDGTWLEEWVPESDGDPEPLDDAIVDPGASRERYLERAERVAGGG